MESGWIWTHVSLIWLNGHFIVEPMEFYKLVFEDQRHIAARFRMYK